MQTIKITKNDHNKRIDKFLISYYGLPKSIVMKKFRLKDVRVNDIKIKDHNYLLQTGDEIITYFRGVEIKTVKAPNVIPNIDIIFEDKNILLIHKPAGIIVSGDKPNDLHSKVLAYLSQQGKMPENTSYEPINIHRLDKNTTGVVIFSLNYSAHRLLSEAIAQEGHIEKNYIARVKGKFPKRLLLEDKIAHNENEQKMVVNRKYGKIGKLEAECIKNFPNNISLVDVKLITGRKHQVRVQLSHAGFPIMGDPRYGGPKEALINLCAYKITFKELEGELAYLNEKSFECKKPNWAEK